MTVPYVAGTVSVTAGSAVVTGSGTGWQTALVIGGLFGLDSNNGNPVPILSVDSNTQLTLAKPWRGTTAAAQPYWIIRDTDAGRQTVANASGLAQIITELRSTALSAFAGLTPAADKLPYFSSGNVAALADVTEFARSLLAKGAGNTFYGALGEIPNAQLPDRLKEGGELLTSLNTLRRSGFYYASNSATGHPTGSGVLGLIHVNIDSGTDLQIASNSGGEIFRRARAGGNWGDWASMPTAEYGSNANGEYVRFSTGIQICWGAGTVTTASTSNNAFGSTSGGSTWGNATITFPAAFLNGGYTVSNQPTFRGFTVLGAYSKSVGSCVIRMGVAGSTFSDVPFEWSAIGRWK